MATAVRRVRHAAFRAVAVTAAAALAGAGLLTGLAWAHPAPTVAQVRAEIAALGEQASRISEAYDAARISLAADQQAQRAADARLRQVQTKIAALRAEVGRFAAAAYSSDGLGNTALLLADDPTTFIEQATALEAIAQRHDEVMGELQSARRRAARLDLTVRRSLARQQAAERSLASQRARIAGAIAQQQAVLDQLTAAQRASYLAGQAALQQQQMAMRSAYAGPATGAAAVAVQFAYAQLGKPYEYGAAGPGSYDCSGLTMAAWAAAGVSMPHNAADQQAMLPYVPEGDLQPGDLVFFGSPAYHVALYVGNGETIQATHPGDYVRMIPLSAMPDYSGAGRP